MLVQHRADGLRCFAQHEHALVSGRMAHAWHGFDLDPADLSYPFLLACGLHDLPWRAFDETPLYNADTGRPFDFIDLPMERRRPLYSRGLDELSAIHPYVGLLVSRHYCSLGAMSTQVDFQDAEAQRQLSLQQDLPDILADLEQQARDLSLLQFLDVLSLYICLGCPSASERELPSWLNPATFGRYLDGVPIQVSWVGDGLIRVRPSPWKTPFQLTLSYRQLPTDSYASEELLREEWEHSPRGFWRLSVQ